MDDCEGQILPGIMQDTGTYEFRQAAASKLKDYSKGAEFDQVWEITDLQLPYFDMIYSPYLYCGAKSGEDLYEKAFTTDCVRISSQEFNNILKLNIQCLLNNYRASVLVCVADNIDGRVGINFELGVGQFLPIPTVIDLEGGESGICCKKIPLPKSKKDGLIQKVYDGNTMPWKVLGRLDDYHKKSSKKEWPISELNRLLPNEYASVTTMDIYNKFLATVDFCANIDFYIWVGGCAEQWLVWPERHCQALEYEMLSWMQQQCDETGKACEMDDVVRKFEMYEYLPDNLMQRPNVYLGTFKEAMKLCKPYLTSVSNGTFTLDESIFGSC